MAVCPYCRQPPLVPSYDTPGDTPPFRHYYAVYTVVDTSCVILKAFLELTYCMQEFIDGYLFLLLENFENTV